MSATVEVVRFQGYFDGAPLIEVLERLHPIEIFYTQELVYDYFKSMIEIVVQIHACEGLKDILVFLNREEEIEDACGTCLCILHCHQTCNKKILKQLMVKRLL